MAEKPTPNVPDLSRETPATPGGHRSLIWLWIVGLLLLGLAVWGVAKLTTYIRPPAHGNAINGSNSPL